MKRSRANEVQPYFSAMTIQNNTGHIRRGGDREGRVATSPVHKYRQKEAIHVGTWNHKPFIVPKLFIMN